MAARDAELLAVAQKIAFCECWNELLRTYTTCKLFPEGLMEKFGDYLTWSEYVTR